MGWWWLWLVPAAPAAWAAVVGLALATASLRWTPRPGRVGRWLVLVPARGEGAGVGPTLDSVAREAAGRDVETVLLLDGPDPEARRIVV